MSDSTLTCKVALSFLKRSNADLIRTLHDNGVTPDEFFMLDTHELTRALRLNRNSSFNREERDAALSRARREVELMEKHRIKGYFLLDPDYPIRLSHTPDAPVMLYQLGNTDLNAKHIINIVGTRKPTLYGLNFCSRLVEDLAAYFPGLVVVSGLAFGIDASAHNASLSNNLPTVGVVAHGLNMIYPAPHRSLARSIIQSGGSIVTEYPFGEQPYPQRFLERNRIIAGFSDVTIVAESDIRGGAMSTANTAFSYSRDVMALPGRISDQLSSGCNHLIRKEKAHLITCAADLIELTGWKPLDLNINTNHRNLFPELDGDAKLIYETIRFSNEPVQIDRIHLQTQIPMTRLISTLGEMEFDGILLRHPGNRYSLA